jgi:acid phosphatase
MSFIRAPFRLLIFVYTIVVVFLFYRAYISKPPRREIGPEHRAAFPHAGSWATWFIPGKNPKVERQNNPMQGWNILHHLGGNGPWIEHVKGEPSSLATPEECSVDQIHLV